MVLLMFHQKTYSRAAHTILRSSTYPMTPHSFSEHNATKYL